MCIGGAEGFPTRVRGSSKGYSKAEITTVLSRMGVSGVTVKKLEKLSSDQESRQVCFKDMTKLISGLQLTYFRLWVIRH